MNIQLQQISTTHKTERESQKEKYRLSKIGLKFVTNGGEEVEIIEYENCKNCTIRFSDGSVKSNVPFIYLVTGAIRNKNKITTTGKGYFGIGKYVGYINGKETKAYSTWRGMLKRCFDEKHQSKHVSYIGVTLCEEWYNFQNFAKWHEENYNPEIMQGWQLDKDALCPDCKIYSPETCCFLPAKINSMLQKQPVKNKAGLPKGVTKVGAKFYSVYNGTYLGAFKTVDEAGEVYIEYKKQNFLKVLTEFETTLPPHILEILKSKIHIFN